MIRRNDRKLFLISLRVLVRVAQGETPSRRDMIILRRCATPDEADLPADELCCVLIRRELEFSERTVLQLAG